MNQPDWTAAVDRILARVERESDRTAGAIAGVSSATINRWRELRRMGASIPEPRGEPRNTLLRALGFEPQGVEETPEEAVAANMPDVSFLKPRAREIYDRAVGSYVTRRWPQPILERASWDLVNYIMGANTLRSSGPGRPELTEEEQCMVLERTVVHVEKAYGPNGVVRRF